MTFDEKYMRRALALAERGRGLVSPNPMVGCVIVKSGKITGEGWHEHYGQAHAEVNAVGSAHGNLRDATVYVTLEPCAHEGKTPPCVEYLIAHKPKRVVVGMVDPYPPTNGVSIRKMKRAGIDVMVGVCEAECRELNKGFISLVTTSLPYVTLKLAMTLDGFIATARGESKWITGEAARMRAHELRARHDAIMVGTQTAKKDDPALTVRLPNERVSYRNVVLQPFRIVLDRTLRLPSTLQLFSDVFAERTIVITSEKKMQRRHEKIAERGVEFDYVPSARGILKMENVLKSLAARGITSVMVEGGAALAGELLQKKMVDEVVLFIAPKLLGAGISFTKGFPLTTLANAMNFEVKEIEKVGGDVMVRLLLK